MLADSVVNAHSLQKGRATESAFLFHSHHFFRIWGLCF